MRAVREAGLRPYLDEIAAAAKLVGPVSAMATGTCLMLPDG